MFTLDREPTGPGEILSFLKPMNITQRQLAEHMGCDVKGNRIVNGRTAIRAAGRLASALNTSPEFWLNAQQAVDVHGARRKIRDLPESIVMN